MQTNLSIKVSELTPEYAEGILQLFSASAQLDITITYELKNSVPSTQINIKADSTSKTTPGKKRGPKPKNVDQSTIDNTPKKRGRKPKVVEAA